MNRRQKIIVSITGIFIVLLALVGLTYAYFLTRITGNENDKSISVTTANLELVYDDGTDGIITNTDPIIPGEFESSKSFTVSNTGTTKIDNYAVIIDNYSVKYVNAVPTENIQANDPTYFVRQQDWKMTITCTITSQDASRNNTICNGVDGTLPDKNDILVTNSIESGDVHNYTITIEYIEAGTNQSADMNKRIEAKLNIIDGKDTVDLGGTVSDTNVAYVELTENITPSQTSDNSESKIQFLDEMDNNAETEQLAFETIRSYINSKKEYKLVGVPAGKYDIKMYNKSNTQVGNTQTFDIVKGDAFNSNNNMLTFSNMTRSIKVDLTTTNYLVGSLENGYTKKDTNLAYKFSEGETINFLTNTIVEDSEIKSKAVSLPFTVDNIGDTHQNITIKLTDVVMDEALKNEDFRWGLYNADTGIGLSFGIFKYTENEEIIYTDTIIDAKSYGKNYVLRIWVHNNGTEQTGLLKKSFSAKVSVSGEAIEYTPESCFEISNTGELIDYKCYNEIETDSGYEITPDSITDIVIPKTINNKNVTNIISEFFNNTGEINRFIMPDKINKMECDSYYLCPLYVNNITIPEGMTKFVMPDSVNGTELNFKVFIPDTVVNLEIGFKSDIKSLVLPGTLKNPVIIFKGNDLIFMDGIDGINGEICTSSTLNYLELPKSVNNIYSYENYTPFMECHNLNEIILRGKTEIPSGFGPEWNCNNLVYYEDTNTTSCTSYAKITYR